MKKTIKLTEADLTRIIKRVINEQKAGDDAPINVLPKEIQDFVQQNGLTGVFNYVGQNGQLGVRWGYKKGNVSSDISVQDIQTYNTYKGIVNKVQRIINLK